MAAPPKLDPMFVTTDALVAAGGVTAITIHAWVKAGLLPEPRLVSSGSPGGLINIYPAWAVERARFIREKRQGGHTLEEVRALVEAMDGRTTSRRLSRSPAKSAGKRR